MTTLRALSIADAQRTIAEHSVLSQQEMVFVADARARVLASGLSSSRALPGFDNSAMDGYAVRASDVVGADRSAPSMLRATGASRAGHTTTGTSPLAAGEAQRVMTGAAIPLGANAVVAREDTDESRVDDGGCGDVSIFFAAPTGHHIRRRGEDVEVGALIAVAGDVITPARMNLLIAAGHTVVPVRKRPVVAILSSGDELKEIGLAVRDDDVINSNAHAVAALVRDAGGEPHLLGIAKDTLDEHIRRIEAAAFADVLITIGGVSVGTHDFVRPALLALAAREHFWKVSMRPGKPLAFSTNGKQLIFSLPGNPVSSFVSFELFVRPALRRMQGARNPYRRRIRAEYRGKGFSKKAGLTFFARGQLALTDDGFFVHDVEKQGSAHLSGLAMANALIVFAQEAEQIERGAVVDVIALDDGFLFGDS